MTRADVKRQAARRHSALRWGWLAIGSALLGGCNLAPKYQAPVVEIPKNWREATPSDTLPKGEWWTIFGDDRLNGYVHTALTNNLTLQQQVTTLAEARAQLDATRAAYYPQVSGDAEAIRERTTTTGVPVQVNTRRQLTFSTGTVIIPEVELQYEVDLWGQVRNSVNASYFTTQARLADLETVRLETAVMVVETYLSICAVDQDATIVRQSIDIREQNLKIVRARFNNALASDLDVNQAITEVDSAKADLIGLGTQRDQLEHALAHLLGQAAPDFAMPPTPLTQSIPIVPAGVPSDLLEQRPDVSSAERQLAAANANIGVARAAFYPELTIIGAAGFESIRASDAFNWRQRVWELGPQVTFPLFEGGRLKAQLEEAKAQYAGAVTTYKDSLLQAFQDVEDALSNQEVLTRQANAENDLVGAAANTVKLAVTRYRDGLTGFVDVINAQDTLLAAQRTANQIQSQRLQSVVQLVRAIGGGWDRHHDLFAPQPTTQPAVAAMSARGQP